MWMILLSSIKLSGKNRYAEKNVPNITKTKVVLPESPDDVFKANHIVPNDTFNLLSLNTYKREFYNFFSYGFTTLQFLSVV